MSIKNAIPVPIYNYDPFTFGLLGESVSVLDQITSEPLFPAYSTQIKPPKPAIGKIAVFNESAGTWTLQPDNRGVVYVTATGERQEYDKIGSLPSGLSNVKPRPFDKWDAKSSVWVFSAYRAAEAQKQGINAACAAQIIAGFKSSALGSPYTYDSTITDQVNLIGVASAGVSMGYQATDAAGVKAELPHTAAQITRVYADGIAVKAALLSKARALKTQLDTLGAHPKTTRAQIENIVW